VDFLKINDRQFIELYPRTVDSQPLGMMHICFETADIEALRNEYLKRNLEPTAVNKARAGNLLFSIHDPEGQMLEYLQYLPGSLHFEDRGHHLGARRISQRPASGGGECPGRGRGAGVLHVSKLAFEDRGDASAPRLRIPGDSREEVELQAASGQARPRIVFAVPDVARATEELRRRGFTPLVSASEVRVTDPDGAIIVFTKEGPDSW
jgi:catechol 2,3-dioxygenase-like lactoylglutathione lyase family enzyme